MQWLELMDFTVHITMKGKHFSVQAVDDHTGRIYTGSGYPLCNALEKAIRKIYKAQKRDAPPGPSCEFPSNQNKNAPLR